VKILAGSLFKRDRGYLTSEPENAGKEVNVVYLKAVPRLLLKKLTNSTENPSR
jgi:protein-arginine kinase